jgi:hypothetical protein
MQRPFVVAAAAALAAFAVNAFAHHSHANYIETDWVAFEGTITEIHWINPHTWIYLKVEGTDRHDGAWALEGASVSALRRQGWDEDSLLPGERIAVRCHPLKDGSRGCLLGFVIKDGQPEKEFD